MSLKLTKPETYWINVKGSAFRIEPLSLSLEERLLKKATRIKKGVEVVNNVAFLKDKFDAVVKEWRDIEINGVKNPPCDREHKDFIVEWFPAEADEVLQAADETRDNNDREAQENLGK